MEFNKLLSFIILILSSVTYSSCWQYFTSLNDLVHENSVKTPQFVNSEYHYGECQRRENRYYTHVYLDHMMILGKVIVRGWINILRIPTCIKIKALGYTEDLFRSTAYQFQICVPRITYCHSQNRYKYFYYEWYLPPDLIGGMNWEIYFYGLPTMSWGD